MFPDDKITEIFYICDEFSKEFDATIAKSSIRPSGRKRDYHRDCRMSDAEIMTILILFHSSNFRCLKHFYLNYVCKHMKELFPKTVSYNRFVELERKAVVKLIVLVKGTLMGKCTGISFIDSTPLRVCRNQRILQHKTFRGLAQRGKCSMGWFFGFKLHVICNEKGEIINFMFTPGNIDDREPLKVQSFTEELYGKLVGDRGYISSDLFCKLFIDGIQLITKLKNKMKNSLMTVADKILLRKRAIIETINDELKNMAQIEHSRHRSCPNFICNMVAAIAAYNFFPKKPMLDLERNVDKQLILF